MLQTLKTAMKSAYICLVYYTRGQTLGVWGMCAGPHMFGRINPTVRGNHAGGTQLMSKAYHDFMLLLIFTLFDI